jgi:hypothetical protein
VLKYVSKTIANYRQQPIEFNTVQRQLGEGIIEQKDPIGGKYNR